MGGGGGINEGCRLRVEEDRARAVFDIVKPCGFAIAGPAPAASEGRIELCEGCISLVLKPCNCHRRSAGQC